MIYILYGNDIKKRNSYIKKVAGSRDVVFVSQSNLSKELISDYASNISLFGESPVIVIEGLISQSDISISITELSDIKKSPTAFIFIEDKLLVADEKKYKKYSEAIEHFETKEVKQISKINTFAIADAFARGDKIATWVLYREAIDAGIDPESISGIIFWKIKMMILHGNKVFPLNVLQKKSSEIVSLYHHAHRGDCDFIIGLEQFILSSLSK